MDIMGIGVSKLWPVLKKVMIGIYGDLIDINSSMVLVQQNSLILAKIEVLQKWTEMFSLLMSKFKKKANQ